MGIDQYGVIGGVESMVSARFTPWHGTSETKLRVETRLTDALEAQALAGIDWTVEEQLLSDIINNPLADEHKLRIRSTDGAVLGVGSPRYGLIQNEALATLSQEIINFRPDAHIESAGSLFHGKVVWMLVKLDDLQKVWNEGSEHHYRYLLAYTSHDGSHPFCVRFVNVRVECMNTFSMSIGKASQVVQRIRHTSNAADYVEEAKSAIQAAVQTFDLLDMELEVLLNQQMTKAQQMDTFKKVLGEPSGTKTGQTLWDKAFDGIVNEYNASWNDNIKNTAWGTVMAVNGYELWEQGSRGQTKADKQMRHLLDGWYPMTEKALALVTPS